MTAIERAAIAAVGMFTSPSKEEVRAAREQHLKDRVLPTPEEYRRELGWFLNPGNKSADCAR